MRRERWGILIIMLAAASSSCASLADSPRFAAARKMGTVETPLISGASGIVASRESVGVLWIHNDFANETRLYALNSAGKLLGICDVSGAKARNWEDIASGPGPEPNQSYIYIGDIGDNNARRKSVQVYRVPEPNVDPIRPFGQMHSAAAETIELTYPDGPRDAETLLVDPQTRDLYIIAKRELFSKVYRAAYPQATTKTTVLTRVASLPWGMATGGDVSPDGRYVLVRGYFNASLWQRPAGEPLWKAFAGPRADVPMTFEPQGEAISFDAAGRGYYTISEGTHPALYYYARIDDGTRSTLSDRPSDPNSFSSPPPPPAPAPTAPK